METQLILFWLIVAGFGGFAALTLWRAASRGGAADPDGTADMRLYRGQLAGIDRDRARGVIADDEAGRLRTEIARRLLDADRRVAAAGGSAGPGARWPVAAAVAAAMGLTVAGYLWLGAPGYPDLPIAERIARAAEIAATRPGQVTAQGPAPALRDPDSPQDAALIAKLRDAVAARPDDLQGHLLLAEQESALGNAIAAAGAQARAVTLMGDAATARDHAVLSDLYVRAAGGYVSPEAEAAARAALARDAGNGTARFYIGLAEAQTGRPDLAFAIWRDLLESSPPAAPWVPVIRDRIGFLAAASGVDYAPPDMPQAEAAAPGAAAPGAQGPGPTAGDVAAAAGMSPEDRQAMIRGMVQGLADRLATEGGPASDWARLIAALGVLGETDRARAIWTEAKGVFAASPDDLAAVTAAARQAGVAE